MNIGKEIREDEFEDPNETPAPVEPAPVEAPAEEPVGV